MLVDWIGPDQIVLTTFNRRVANEFWRQALLLGQGLIPSEMRSREAG